MRRNSTIVITAGFAFVTLGLIFWPGLALLGIVVAIIGGVLREGERSARQRREARREVEREAATEAEVARLWREQHPDD